MKVISFDIDNLLKKGTIENEYELEQAINCDKQLRLLIKDNPRLKRKRTQLRQIIADYESENWSLDSKISQRKIDESNYAERIVEEEAIFNQDRKQLIKSKLSKLSLNQQEFGQLLGHNSKSYTSELLNGISPFSLRDIIVINQLLEIDLKNLVFTTIPYRERRKIEDRAAKLDKPKLSRRLKMNEERLK